MEQLAHPIRQLMPRMFKNLNVDGPIVRMSEINHSSSESFNLSQNFKNISTNMAELSNFVINDDPALNSNDNMQISEELNQEINDLDFKKFVDDLAINVLDEIPVTGKVASSARHPAGRIIYERTSKKETIIIDSIPNRDSDNIQVVKVKISLPKDRDKATMTVLPMTNCTSTFKRTKLSAIKAARFSPKKHENSHHLPIMGKAALLSKRRNSGQFKNNTDSEIVRELVTQRFQDCLLNYYEKSFHRHACRIRENFDISNANDTSEKFEQNCTDDFNGISSIASESLLSISTKTDVSPALTSSSPGTQSNRSFRTSTACCSRLQSTDSLHTDSTAQQDSYEIESIGRLTDDMKFLISTDALNVETANEINLPHSTFEQESPVRKTFENKPEDTVEYDATQFLKDALGDELNNYHSTDASYINSIGTSNISALVSKSDTHEYHSTIYEDSAQAFDYDYYPFNRRIAELLMESNVQFQIILQTSKALGFCKSTKEFSAADEEIEAERILLLATCKREAIRNEIHRLEYEEILSASTSASRGCIRISQIIFPSKQRSSMYSSKLFDKKKKKKFADWHLCILTNGTNVVATSAVQADNDGFIRFHDEMIFDQLTPDFAINIALYSLRIRSQKRMMSHETKYHLDSDASLCPLSPPKIFNSSKKYKNLSPTSNVDQPSYVLCGEFTLKINNIGHLGHFKMAHLNLPSLEGTVIINFVSNVLIRENCSGFLDVGQEIGEIISWNRRWCTLNEGILQYYNYPGEETPLGFIDLHYCATAFISSADREICARPRTLLVEIYITVDDVGKHPATIKYFLAADSKQYMEMWGNKLNSTINALRTWNAMKWHSLKY